VIKPDKTATTARFSIPSSVVDQVKQNYERATINSSFGAAGQLK